MTRLAKLRLDCVPLPGPLGVAVAFAAPMLVSGCFLQDDFYLNEVDSDPSVVNSTPTATTTGSAEPGSTATRPEPADSSIVTEDDDGPILGGKPIESPRPDAAAPPETQPVTGSADTSERSEPSAATTPDQSSAPDAPPVADAGYGPTISEVEAGTPSTPSECTRFSSWGDPEPLLGLGLADAEFSGPSLSSDGLDLYFAAVTRNDGRIYVAHRKDRTLAFSPAEELKAVTSTGTEGSPAISADDLTLIFTSTRVSGQDDLWMMTRSRKDQAFGNPVALDELNTMAGERSPWISEDGLSLLYVTDTARSQFYSMSDIWLATRASEDDVFVEGVPLDAVNSDANDEHAAYSSHGLALYLASDREAREDFDLFLTTRSDLDSDFGEPTVLATQNTDANETDPTLSRDNLELIYASDQDGKMSLWHAYRDCAE